MFNFSQETQADYAVALPGATGIVPLLYSDWEPYGGTSPLAKSVCQLQENQLVCTLQPFSAILLNIEGKMENTYSAE